MFWFGTLDHDLKVAKQDEYNEPTMFVKHW